MKEVRARVVLQEKGIYTISSDEGLKLAEISGKFRFEAVSGADYPAVGDYVAATWPEDGSNAIISSIFPRKSSFIRKAAGVAGREQIVAANIDTVFLCMSLNNDFNIRRLERYLAISWDSGATPVVVLTKADLCRDIDAKIDAVNEVALGVDILTVSSQLDDFDSVMPYLTEGKTVAFIGSSGVGKSTLINRLAGQELIRTSAIREDDHKGRHTTTHRELILLPGGASVIDTPGMRELGLWNNEEGAEKVFADIEALIEKCRFSNCSHGNEKGCAVRVALDSGELSQDRWRSWQKLMAENAYTENEEAYLREKKAKFKKIAAINRRNKKR